MGLFYMKKFDQYVRHLQGGKIMSCCIRLVKRIVGEISGHCPVHGE